MRLRRREPDWLADLLVEPALVELQDGRTIAGLATPHPNSLSLRSARLMTGDGWTALDGEIVVPRDRVAWVQRGILLDDVARVERLTVTRENV